MLMTTGKLIMLRTYNVTLGRWAVFSRLLRKMLVTALVTGKRDRYVPASKYFDPKELD